MHLSTIYHCFLLFITKKIILIRLSHTRQVLMHTGYLYIYLRIKNLDPFYYVMCFLYDNLSM